MGVLALAVPVLPVRRWTTSCFWASESFTLSLPGVTARAAPVSRASAALDRVEPADFQWPGEGARPLRDVLPGEGARADTKPLEEPACSALGEYPFREKKPGCTGATGSPLPELEKELGKTLVL